MNAHGDKTVSECQVSLFKSKRRKWRRDSFSSLRRPTAQLRRDNSSQKTQRLAKAKGSIKNRVGGSDENRIASNSLPNFDGVLNFEPLGHSLSLVLSCPSAL